MWYVEGIGAPGHDPDKARALVREAGYDGKVIEIMVRQGQDQETEAAVLQAQLSRIGLKAKQDLVDSSAYLTRSRTGEFALKFSGGNFDPDPSPTYDLVCPPDLKKRTSNASAYCDPEMDLLIARAEKEMDPQKRRELFRQIVRKVSEDAPEVPIGFVPRVFTFRESVKDFTTNAEGAFRWLGGGLNYVWLER
jgi:ABC-type transport system substrate-binding protein